MGSRLGLRSSTFLSYFMRVLVGRSASRPDIVRVPCQTKGIPKSLSAGLMLLVAAGCEQEASVPPMPKDAVATVGKAVITEQDFLTQLSRRSRVGPGEPIRWEERQALLEEMIRFEVLHQKALAAGYDKLPEITSDFKRLVVAKYREDQLARLGGPSATAEEVLGYYRAHADRFGSPERVRAALIEIRVGRTAPFEKRAEIAAKAEAVLAEAVASPAEDGTFGLLAQRNSEDQVSRYRGGDIGWVTVGTTNGSWPPEVLSALFRLKQPGELAPVVETATAFYLVKLVERRPAEMRPLEEVRAGVEYLASREKKQQREECFYAGLRQEYEIRINHTLLKSMELPHRLGPPPPLPAGATARADQSTLK